MANWIILRDTISKQTHTYTEELGRQLLAHPTFGPHLEEVKSEKPEVLSPPSVKDEDGSKSPVSDTKAGDK